LEFLLQNGSVLLWSSAWRVFMKVLNLLFLALFCALICTNAYAKEKEYFKNRIEVLEKRVKQLESEKTKPKADFFQTSNPRLPMSSRLGNSRAFNPAISVNGLLLGTYTNEGRNDSSRETKTGLSVQEVELRLSSSIDTYLNGVLTIAFEGDEVEIEEAFATLIVTGDLSLTAGRFFAPFGKHAQLHTHAFPFIDAPLVVENILGEEGLNEVGLGLAWLLPTPWYSEIYLVVLEGDNPLFNGALNDDLLYFTRWKNLFDISDELTMEMGGSFAYGRNELGSGPYDTTQVSGADLTFKWRPAGRERYRTLIWQSEFISSSRDVDKKGVYSLAQFQFARRWWIQGRYDYYTIPRDQVGGTEVKQTQQRYSALLAFVMTEFSAVRLQYNRLNTLVAEDEHQVFLQLNFTFGSHPAHAY
jgi:hypothetical protein